MQELFANYTEYYLAKSTRKAAFVYLQSEIKEAGLMHPHYKELIRQLMDYCYLFEKKARYSLNKAKLAVKMIDNMKIELPDSN